MNYTSTSFHAATDSYSVEQRKKHTYNSEAKTLTKNCPSCIYHRDIMYGVRQRLLMAQ